VAISTVVMMNSETRQLIYSLIPKLPLIARVAVLHVLRLSQSSDYLDLRSALIVALIRDFMAPARPLSITETQKLGSWGQRIKGRIWVSKYTAPEPPELGVRDVLMSAIDRLWSAARPPAGLRLPDVVPVDAEWTAYRADADATSSLPLISEREKFDELMKGCKTSATILYFHGGAYIFGDPATHRPTTKKLAKLTGGRCYSVRYRLAPQNPFPSALLDALLSYMALLYPPPGAFHEPVAPKDIIFSGDR
jgi:acetyl esterase/lipase